MYIIIITINTQHYKTQTLNTLNAKLNPICHLLELLDHHILHVSRVGVNYNWVILGDMFRPLNGHPQANLEQCC
jgi:hypothetical protein